MHIHEQALGGEIRRSSAAASAWGLFRNLQDVGSDNNRVSCTQTHVEYAWLRISLFKTQVASRAALQPLQVDGRLRAP
eukprot:812400-Prymnesium_polylepis.3